MEKTVIRVKGIVKKNGKYLLLKKWYDDRIPDPFMWEFIDGNVNFGENPVDAQERIISECLGTAGCVIRPLYTWSTLVGDTHILGIAYQCEVEDCDSIVLPEEYGEWAWVEKTEFEDYIENINLLHDLQNNDI